MAEKNIEELSEEVFMVVAAMMVCLGHGANDVSNSISPLVVAA
jgi:phosphate/sulfate permease